MGFQVRMQHLYIYDMYSMFFDLILFIADLAYMIKVFFFFDYCHIDTVGDFQLFVTFDQCRIKM